LNKREDCFRQGLLRKVEPSSNKSRESIIEAREWLSESRKNMDAEAYKSAISSLYLAIFHSARAVLFRDGVREKSHYCVGVYLRKYIEQGVLEEDWVLIFDRMRSVRHTDQYSFQVHPSKEEVESGIDIAGKFVNRMEKLLNETGGAER
jgi:uncharacterized protein (UPF0332 family)